VAHLSTLSYLNNIVKVHIQFQRASRYTTVVLLVMFWYVHYYTFHSLELPQNLLENRTFSLMVTLLLLTQYSSLTFLGKTNCKTPLFIVTTLDICNKNCQPVVGIPVVIRTLAGAHWIDDVRDASQPDNVPQTLISTVVFSV